MTGGVETESDFDKIIPPPRFRHHSPINAELSLGDVSDTTWGKQVIANKT
jgi:hypothetical protein